MPMMKVVVVLAVTLVVIGGVWDGEGSRTPSAIVRQTSHRHHDHRDADHLCGDEEEEDNEKDEPRK